MNIEDLKKVNGGTSKSNEDTLTDSLGVDKLTDALGVDASVDVL